MAGITDALQATPSPYPDLSRLTSWLASVLHQSGGDYRHFSIIKRIPNIEASTFPSEIVTCRIGSNKKITVFCKYAALKQQDRYGHKRGVAYEAEVYRQVLQGLKLPLPKFYGVYRDKENGQIAIILEYLRDTTRVSRAPNINGMLKASQWLGAFHAINETRLTTAQIPFLSVYDEAYYRGWPYRVLQFTREFKRNYSWLYSLCGQFEDLIAILSGAPMTVIHGEFYSQNVLMHNGRAYPVDWESAAIAAGEIDLASLTDRWPEEIVTDLKQAYQQTRWGNRSNANFDCVFELARLYTQFRWLGDWAEFSAKDCEWRFEQLRFLAKRLGLI